MIAFIRMEKFKKSNFKAHVNHVLRIKTALVKNPKRPIVLGDGDGDTDILQKIQHDTPRKKDGNVAFEIVVSGVDEIEKYEKIKEYLEKTLKRETLCVIHEDESKKHAHFIVRYHDDNNKALRLKLSDFNTIKKNIANITKHELKLQGGRKRISFREYIADKESAQQRIEMMKKRDEITKKVLKKLLNIYKEIKLYAVSDAGRIELETISSESDIEKVSMKRLRMLEKKGENILFAPTQNSNHVVFLDDIQESELSQLPPQSIVVKTSDEKYQAHIPLMIHMNIEEYKAFQKYCVFIFDADISASDIYHLRRVPCFVNNKYLHQPVVKFVKNTGNGSLKKLFDDFKKFALLEKEEKEENKNRIFKLFKLRSDSNSNKSNKDKTKKWEDFVRDGLSASEVDFRYCIFLHSKSYDKKEIRKILTEESPLLFERKKNHVDDYLDRTIEKSLLVYLEKIKVLRQTQTQNTQNDSVLLQHKHRN